MFAARARVACRPPSTRTRSTIVVSSEVMRRIGYSGWIGIEYIWIDWEHGNETTACQDDSLSATFSARCGSGADETTGFGLQHQ